MEGAFTGGRRLKLASTTITPDLRHSIMSIRMKILLAIAFSVAFSIAGVGIMTSVQMNKAFINNFQISGKAQLDRMNSFSRYFFDSAVSNAKLLAVSPAVQASLQDLTSYVKAREAPVIVGANLPPAERGLYEEMNRMHTVIPGYTLIYVCNTDGGITLAPDVTLGPGFDPTTRPWFKAVAQKQDTVITEAYVSASDNAAVCTVATPVRVQNRFAGVAAIDIRLDTLSKEVGAVSIGKTGYVVMLDNMGRVIVDPRNSAAGIPENRRWLGKTVQELPSDVSKAIGALLAQKEGYAEAEFDGTEWLASVRTTEEGWALLLLQEKAEVFADAMGVTLGILLAGVLIIVIMLAVAWLLARSLTRPLEVLALASQGVAEGNLQAIPQEEAPFKGELGLLHRSLKQMVAKLAELIETANSKMRDAEEALALSKRSLQEAEDAKKLAEQARRDGVLHTANQLGSVIGELAAATHRLADGASRTEQRAAEQHERISGTSVAITQMSNAVGEVASSSSRTAELADNSRAESQNGRKLVNGVVDSMSEIEKQSLAMSERLSGLGAQANDIGAIMNVISDIADQTNLLALNAAIEAARAGEAGRGFAVVADEVRKLAEKTMEATKQVGQAITAIQQGTSGNMDAMNKVADFVSQSTATARKAGESLEEIEKLVDGTAGEVRSIATASEEQSATLEEINRSAEGINTLAAEIAENADMFSKEIRDLTALSDKLTVIVGNLKSEGAGAR